MKKIITICLLVITAITVMGLKGSDNKQSPEVKILQATFSKAKSDLRQEQENVIENHVIKIINPTDYYITDKPYVVEYYDENHKPIDKLTSIRYLSIGPNSTTYDCVVNKGVIDNSTPVDLYDPLSFDSTIRFYTGNITDVSYTELTMDNIPKIYSQYTPTDRIKQFIETRYSEKPVLTHGLYNTALKVTNIADMTAKNSVFPHEKDFTVNTTYDVNSSNYFVDSEVTLVGFCQSSDNYIPISMKQTNTNKSSLLQKINTTINMNVEAPTSYNQETLDPTNFNVPAFSDTSAIPVFKIIEGDYNEEN